MINSVSNKISFKAQNVVVNSKNIPYKDLNALKQSIIENQNFRVVDKHAPDNLDNFIFEGKNRETRHKDEQALANDLNTKYPDTFKFHPIVGLLEMEENEKLSR